MQLDDLKDAWTSQGAVLERSLRIDERLLRELLLRKARHALAPSLSWTLLELVLGVVVLCLVVTVLLAHGGEPRYLVVGGLAAGCIMVIVVLTGRVLVQGLRIDFGGPVTAIQRDLERLRRAEYRALTWAVLGGVLVWLPAALVLFEAATGVEALARVELPWLVANLMVGLAVLAVGLVLSRRYVERPDLGPRARRLVEAVSGRGPRRAARHLAELASFGREDSPPGPA